jgi:hypothetical protein
VNYGREVLNFSAAFIMMSRAAQKKERSLLPSDPPLIAPCVEVEQCRLLTSWTERSVISGRNRSVSCNLSTATTSRQDAIPSRPRARDHERASPIDQKPLPGSERYKFKSELFNRTKVKATAHVVLNVILDDFCWGRADCFPLNQAIADKANIDVRHVKRVLRRFEELDIILCISDQSIRSRRRIIITSHPNAAAVLDELRKSPFLVASNPCLNGVSKDAAPNRCKGDKLSPMNLECKGDISCGCKGDISCTCKGDISCRSSPYRSKKYETSSSETPRDDDVFSIFSGEEENAPTPQGNSEPAGQRPILPPQPSVVSAPVDRHAANGAPAAPAAAKAARGDVSATEADQDADEHHGTPISHPKGLPANSQDPAPVPAAADRSAPIPGEIIDKLRAELGDEIADEVADNPAQVREASDTDREVLFAAARKMKHYVKKAHNPYRYYLEIVKEFAKDGIPEKYAKSPQKPAVVYFKASLRTEEEKKENAEQRHEAVRRIREMAAAPYRARLEKQAQEDALASQQANRNGSRSTRLPISDWSKDVLADPIIASDPVVANVVGRGDAPDQRTGSPQEAELAEAV